MIDSKPILTGSKIPWPLCSRLSHALVQHDVRDVRDIFATRWESGESIGRRIRMHRPLDFRARHHVMSRVLLTGGI